MIKDMSDKVVLHKHFAFVLVTYYNEGQAMSEKDVLEGIDMNKFPSPDAALKYLQSLKMPFEDSAIEGTTPGHDREFNITYVCSAAELEREGVSQSCAERWARQLGMTYNWQNMTDTQKND